MRLCPATVWGRRGGKGKHTAKFLSLGPAGSQHSLQWAPSTYEKKCIKISTLPFPRFSLFSTLLLPLPFWQFFFFLEWRILVCFMWTSLVQKLSIPLVILSDFLCTISKSYCLRCWNGVVSTSCCIRVTNIQTGAPWICMVTRCCFRFCSLLLSWHFLTHFFDFHWADALIELSAGAQRYLSWVMVANFKFITVFIQLRLFIPTSITLQSLAVRFVFHFNSILKSICKSSWSGLICITLIFFFSSVSFVTSFFSRLFMNMLNYSFIS